MGTLTCSFSSHDLERGRMSVAHEVPNQRAICASRFVPLPYDTRAACTMDSSPPSESITRTRTTSSRTRIVRPQDVAPSAGTLRRAESFIQLDPSSSPLALRRLVRELSDRVLTIADRDRDLLVERSIDSCKITTTRCRSMDAIRGGRRRALRSRARPQARSGGMTLVDEPRMDRGSQSGWLPAVGDDDPRSASNDGMSSVAGNQCSSGGCGGRL